MSGIKISRDTVKKLTHESIEIRLRTLEQISSKLHRALALNECIEFKPGDLCKHLILWFAFAPVQQPLKVLNLLKSIIESPKYGSKAIEKLGTERLIKELRKIMISFDNNGAEQNTINELQKFLESIPVSKVKNKFPNISENFEDLTKKVSSIKIKEEEVAFDCEDYEIPWSRPSPSDYTSMKFLSDILINKFASNVEFENAICHLQITMEDYPAEYLLQAPHIFQNLLKLFNERNTESQKSNIDIVAAALLQFLHILDERLKMLRKSMALPLAFIIKDNSQSPCQLKITKALTELFDASVFHLESRRSHLSVTPIVWEVLFMVLKVLRYIKSSVNTLSLCKVAAVLSSLSCKFSNAENCQMLRLHQMLLTFLLQDVIQKNVCCLKEVEILEPFLRDYSLKYFFKTRHQLLETYILNTDKSLNKKYQLLKLFEDSFETSIKMLNNSYWSCSDIIKEGHNVCKVLDTMQSKELLNILFRAVINAIPLYLTNIELKEQAINLLLKLLSITFVPLKIHIYDKLTDSFKRHIGCLMTGERYVLDCSNAELLRAQIVGVPLNTELLVQIVHESFESSNDQIQRSCCKILELFLQSQTLFGTQWCSLLPILVPMLPLLNCCTFSKKIMDLMLKFYNPDLKQLPYVCVLKGNIGFLFHSNEDRRRESLNRLIYTLNSLQGAENYLPNLLEISDTLSNDICLQNTPREYRNIFIDRSPVRSDVVTNLNNILHLLESPDVEPLIRKTTLMQLNVLCSNWSITAELCSLGAYYLILQTLESSLQKLSELDYVDAVVPAISILNKIMLYDSSVRCELAETPNIYVLLLRSLMMFHNLIQIRQDAAMCLFQLVFSSQLISTENCIEGPLILGNIKLPLDVNLRSALSNKIQQKSEELSQIFSSALKETQYWRMVIASTYCGDLTNLTPKSITILSQLDVRDDLKLTCEDFRFIRATQPILSLNRSLQTALNATEHRLILQACQLLKQQLFMATLNDTFSITEESCNEINNILKRYLRVTPGNSNDYFLYENLLDVTNICLKIPLVLVGLDIFKYLLMDTRHALITMLTQDEETPLRIFSKITTLLRLLIDEYEHLFEAHFNASEFSSFVSKMFDLLVERSLRLFEIRDLQRVRCLLSLLVIISSCRLNISDQLLFLHCRQFFKLSLSLKSFTQTGAQWHRDCLLAILKLSDQMQNPNENFRLTARLVKYLSGLCGHKDVEVRTLAWSLLNVTAKVKAIDSLKTEEISLGISGIEMLISELSYLPGGFMACCFSTLLDAEEVICVRHLAGQLLAVLIRAQENVEEVEEMLNRFYFTRAATEALNSPALILEMEIPMDMSVSLINVTTCDLISCYLVIFIALSQRSPTFLNELCKKSFMYKLYEILKQPPPLSKYIGYLNMIGHICCLYTLCYPNNFDFLQRTMCRDIVLLENFCEVLFRTAAPSKENYITCNMLQLFLILCKDSTALEQIIIKLQDYSMDTVKLFQDAFNVRNFKTSLQSCSLSVLSFFLFKAQPEVDEVLSIHILNLFESKSVPITAIKCNEMLECDNKENNNTNQTDKNLNLGKGEALKVTNEAGKTSISEHLCISLIQLFTHIFPTKAFKFSTPPNVNQQHITETLALLLKQLPLAQKTAQNLKFQEKVMTMLQSFFDEFSTTSCLTYVKRNGENKKMAVIKNFQLLLKLLLAWHSSPAMVITDNILAMEYNKTIILIWPWLTQSNDLKLTVLQVCSFLSENSLVVCKQFSTVSSPFPHSVLQLVAKMVTAETLKIKAHSTDCSTHISAGLRILMNCCSCLEGRTALNKIHILNVIDSLYPLKPKLSQSKLDIDIAWLVFWELFSRYDEGAQSHHLSTLCAVVNKSLPGCSKRVLSLRILRNMAFLNGNRSKLMTSNDFIYTVNEIVSQPITDSFEEQFIVCVVLWKLISGGIKFVTMIRGTTLYKSLRLLKENVTDQNNKAGKFSNDLLSVLNIIFKIFKS